MRTTIDLPDKLFREVKAKTGREGITLKEFFTEAAREKLNRPAVAEKRGRVKFPIIPKSKIPFFPSLTNAEIEAIFNEEDIERYNRLVGPDN